MSTMLSIKDLHASIDGNEILKGLSLEVKPGEVHAIMGPNGSGKSTLGQVLAGRDEYEVSAGEVLFEGKDLLSLSIEERAAAGLFLAFQYPVEIPGVVNNYFLRASLNAMRKARGEDELDAYDFIKLLKEKMDLLEMSDEFKTRYVNVGFSGGEKKRNEILQLVVLNPKLAILDEIDSGLDVDALRLVAKGVNALRNEEHSFILVTHYQRMLDYIEPDYVHVLKDGRIARSGDAKLALEVEETGYVDIAARAGA